MIIKHLKLIFFITLTAFIFLPACRNKDMPFTKAGWNQPCDGTPCPVLRDKMLNDLLNNHKLIGLTYQQIISKIGNVDNHEQTPSGLMRYEITTEYTYGDIVHIKALDLFFNEDSIVTTFKIINYDVDM